MDRFRNQIKKFIYKLFGENIYRAAYIQGKIRNINSGKGREDEMDLIHHFISPDSTVLDIGANYGHYTIEMSRLATAGKVYAFEPVPFTFQVLEKIVSHFEANNVLLEQAAVYKNEGIAEMSLPLLGFGAPNTGLAYIGTNEGATDSRTVTARKIRIDDMEIHGRVDFIKIDIEGQEPFAFEGMSNLIHTHQPVVLLEFSYTCLKRAGFDPLDFAGDLQQNWNYRFARKINGKLELADKQSPPDGYYFLIPGSKLKNYESLFQ